jgi:hypothetical protein
MNEQPGKYFYSLETIIWVKILKFFFDADPGSRMVNLGSGIRVINIPDPQHWDQD